MRISFIIVFSGIIIAASNLYKGFEGWDRKTFYPPSPLIQHFAFGHSNSVADAFWLRVVQDFGYCEQNGIENSFSESGVRFGPNRTPSCKMGWMFRTLDLIMDLAPKFETAAEVGPITLSVIADDIEGATALFEKSLRNFPNNWIIAYRAAYHYMVELEDSHRAADLFMQAYRNGAPEWTPLLAAKLQQKVGRLEVAKLILEDFLKQDLQGLENIEAAEKKMKELNRILKKRGD